MFKLTVQLIKQLILNHFVYGTYELQTELPQRVNAIWIKQGEIT